MTHTVTQQSHVDLLVQKDRVVQTTVCNCGTSLAVQDGLASIQIETFNVARKTGSLVILRWWKGGKGSRLCSLGRLRRLRRLGSIHAGLGVCRELDLMHFEGVVVGERDIEVDGKRRITIRRTEVFCCVGVVSMVGGKKKLRFGKADWV